jgi:hypothetical protein
VHLPFPRVASRAALASAQLIVYHERFQLDRRQLLLYHDTYTRSSELFSAAYQKEVRAFSGSVGLFPEACEVNGCRPFESRLVGIATTGVESGNSRLRWRWALRARR